MGNPDELLGPLTHPASLVAAIHRCRRRSSAWLITASAVALVSTMLVSRPVAALPANPDQVHTSCGRIVETRYTNPWGFPWTANAKSAFEDSAEAWEVGRSYNNKKVDIRFNSANPEVDVYFNDLLELDGIVGQADCLSGDGYVELNPYDLIDEDGEPCCVAWPWIGGHEIGHVMGLGHVGKEASRDGDNPPLMTSCYTAAYNGRYSQDDEAALLKEKAWINPPPIHANNGFERGTEYWGKTGGTWEEQSSNNADGSRHIRWKPTSTSQYIYQTVDYIVQDNGPQVTDKLDARVNHRLDSSSHGGDVKVELLTQLLDVQGTSSCFLSGLDEHDREIFPGWTLRGSTGWVSVGSGWDWDTTATYTIPSAWDGTMVRVRVKSSVKTSGGSGSLTWVHLDTTRARAR